MCGPIGGRVVGEDVGDEGVQPEVAAQLRSVDQGKNESAADAKALEVRRIDGHLVGVERVGGRKEGFILRHLRHVVLGEAKEARERTLVGLWRVRIQANQDAHRGSWDP